LATRIRPASVLADVRGGVRLAVDSVSGVTAIVEAMHGRIARGAPPLGTVPDLPTRGITGFVYRSIRGTTSLVGKGLDAALAAAQAMIPPPAAEGEADDSFAREAWVAALNGVLGDHLERTDNPLATTMTLRPRGVHASQPTAHVLVLIHGLCMNDLLWTRSGHDHGQSLGEALGLTPIYLRYNSGRHISANGRDLASELEVLLQRWPVPVETLTIVGHSMGGLVARSAAHQAAQAGMRWPSLLRRLAFLGSPHHGAPLERGGNWLHRGLGISPYAAPFTRLSGLRSEGITDLRHGNLLESDWARDRFSHRDQRAVLPLPAGVACFAVAGTLGESEGSNEWLGDGLVPLASALGRHARPTRDLHIPPSHQYVARGVHHLDLLCDPAVSGHLRRWLSH
jgi:pimeloyl-ACP methyl ester carboxylesterase